MAIINTKNESSVKLSLDCGIGQNGKTVVKSKTFGNLKNEALDDDIYEVVESIVGLQGYNLLKVNRIDNATLSK